MQFLTRGSNCEVLTPRAMSTEKQCRKKPPPNILLTLNSTKTQGASEKAILLIVPRKFPSTTQASSLSSSDHIAASFFPTHLGMPSKSEKQEATNRLGLYV